jgi:hypothetical protein
VSRTGLLQGLAAACEQQALLLTQQQQQQVTPQNQSTLAKLLSPVTPYCMLDAWLAAASFWFGSEAGFEGGRVLFSSPQLAPTVEPACRLAAAAAAAAAGAMTGGAAGSSSSSSSSSVWKVAGTTAGLCELLFDMAEHVSVCVNDDCNARVRLLDRCAGQLARHERYR